METKAQNDGNSIDQLQAKIKSFEEKAVEAARNLAIRTPDSKRTLSDLDVGVQSLSVDKDIVLGDTEEGVQSLPEDDWDEGFQSLPEGELDSGVQSLEANENIVFGNKGNGVQSFPVDDLDKGVQCLPLDEDILPGEQVPSLDGHEAVVPDFEQSPK